VSNYKLFVDQDTTKKTVKDPEGLDVYQKADKLVLEIYAITNKYFPAEERFCLSSQLRRSAISVPANIAEGFNRQYINDYIRFVRISLASLSESIYYIKLATKLRYLPVKNSQVLLRNAEEIARMLQGLIHSLKKYQK